MIEKPENLDPELYYTSFIEMVPEKSIYEALENSLSESVNLMQAIEKSAEDYAYAEGKWTVKQLFQHLIDCERILSYRALSVARNEKGTLLGFNEDDYVLLDGSTNNSLESIMNDFKIARASTISLLKSLPMENMTFVGDANGINADANMIFWFIAGHHMHHNKVFKERYL